MASSRWLDRVLVGGFFVGIFLIFLQSPVDTDLGWQLRYGDYFLAHGRPLMENTLSTLMAGYRWANDYTLYQPLVALGYRYFSLWGLSVINGLIFVASFLFIYLFFGKNLVKTLVTATVAILGGWGILDLGLRAQILSFFFLSLLLYILRRVEGRRRKLLALGLTFLLWANFHGGFSLGLMLVGLWVLAEIVGGFLAKKPWRELVWITYFTWPAVAFLATLINPYGFGIYDFVFQHLQTPMRALIWEWVAPLGVYQGAMVVLFGAYFVLWLVNRRKRPNIFWLLASLLVFYLAFSARRQLPFFFLIQSLAFWELLVPKGTVGWLANPRRGSPLVIPLLLAMFLAGLAVGLPRTVRLNTNWPSYCSEGIVAIPCGAVEFARANYLQGNVFNDYEWGGFLIWQLPENKVFVDGRMPAWPEPSGKSPYTIFLEVLQARSGYQAVLDRYDISWLMISTGCFLDIELKDRMDTPWREVYRDGVAVIYLRKS